MKKDNTPVMILLAIIFILLFGGFGMMGFGWMGGMMSGIYGGFGIGFFGWLFMPLILIILILLIVWLIKQIQDMGIRR